MTLRPTTRFALRPISPPLNVVQQPVSTQFDEVQPDSPTVSESSSAAYTAQSTVIDNVKVVPIPGDPGYYADFEGNVYSKRRGPLKMLSVSIVRGYPSTSVMRPQSKAGTRVYVHTLVCTAHHGPRPSPEHEVRHLDGDPMNNHPSNVAWGSKNDNAADKVTHGTEVIGAKNGKAILTDAMVLEIRATIKSDTMSDHAFIVWLANKYDVAVPTIRNVLSHRSWQHLLSAEEKAAAPERAVTKSTPEFRGEGTKISSARRDEMIARRAAGETVVKLAEEYGLSRKHAGTIFRQAGLTRP